MNPVITKNIKEPIIHLKLLENESLVVVDAKTTIRYLNSETLEVLNGFKAKIHHASYKTNVVYFSPNGKYFASITPDCKESRLYNVNTKKATARVNRHQGEVSCVGIDSKNRYMFSSGEDGKTFAVDIRSSKLAFTLPSHADTVNDIAFSENGNWVATVSYDRKISIFNLSMMTQKHRLKHHSAPVMKARFLKQHRLLTVDKNAKAVVCNIHTGKVLKRLDGAHDDVTQIVTSTDDKFLFVGTALGYILVYDLDSYKLLAKKYIKLSASITALEFNHKTNHLIIGTEEGDLLFYDIYEGEDKINELFKHKKFEEIQKEESTNPILAYTKVFELVSNLWENTLEKAKICLQNGDRKTAEALLSNFKHVPSRNSMIQKVLAEYMDYEKFVVNAKQGKLTLAYSLANQHPMYKESKLYKSLEARWRKVFASAQKYALQPKGVDKAKEILAPYRGISEKTKLIQDLFTKGQIYKRFRVSIGQKDFKMALELAKQHPFLKEFPEYTTIMNYADTLYTKARKLILDGDTHPAIKLLRVLGDFDDFKAEVHEMIRDIESKQKFFIAVQEKDFVLAYNLLDQTEDLQETKDGKALIARWNDDLEVANAYAAEGNIEALEEILQPYMKISSKMMALANVFAWGYMGQLESAIKSKAEKSMVENGIKNFVLSFGITDQLETLYRIFLKYYPDSKLNLELLTHGSMKMWRPSMIVKSILD
jgi:hypothetical protein